MPKAFRFKVNSSEVIIFRGKKGYILKRFKLPHRNVIEHRKVTENEILQMLDESYHKNPAEIYNPGKELFHKWVLQRFTGR